MSSEPVADRSSLKTFGLFAAVAVVALVLRWGVLDHYQAQLANDPDQYRRIGEQWASGKGYSDPQTDQPTAYRPPLYPLLLGVIIRCGGQNAAIGIMQAMLGVATVILTMDAGRRLGLGRGALVAGVLVAIDPLLLYETAQVMTETTAAFLAALCLWLCLVLASPFTSLLIGAAIGAACLCRPTFWAFGIVAGVIWLVRHIRSIDWQEGFSDHGIRPAVLTLAGVLLVVGPWAHRNSTMMGRPVVTTTHGGYTLLLAHNPEYTRAVVDQPWGTVWPASSFDEWSTGLEAELAAVKTPLDRGHLKPAVELARDDWMNRKAWSYIRGNPLIAIKAGCTLLGRLWSVVPAAIDGDARPNSLRLAIGIFYFPVLLAMLVGIWQTMRRKARDWWPTVVMILAFTCVHTLYWADMRMRAPLVPAIALLAAASWFAAPRSATSRGKKN